MSGGYFSYEYIGVESFLEGLESILKRKGDPLCIGYAGHELSEEVDAKIRRAAKEIRLAADKMQAIDYFFSHDIGEKDLLEELNKVVEK